MMNKENPKPKSGRRPSLDKAQNCIMVRFTDKEFAKFLSMYEKSGVQAKAIFIKNRVFNQEFKVVTIDSSMMEFIAKVASLHNQFRAVGVNINQITKVFQTRFSERRAEVMLQNMVKEVMELIKIHSQVLDILQKVEEIKLPKYNCKTLK